jgi:hypothetical protein
MVSCRGLVRCEGIYRKNVALTFPEAVILDTFHRQGDDADLQASIDLSVSAQTFGIIAVSQRKAPEDLGEPDLKDVGFQLCVHGRQFPDATDFCDCNWVRVTAHCGISGGCIWVHGSVLIGKI